MDHDLRPIQIRDLRLVGEQGRRWVFDREIPPLETLTSVRGQLLVIHHDTSLEVRGDAETIITLICDRCLQPFNHCLRFATTEHIWLGQTSHASPPGDGSRSGPPQDAEPDDDGLTVQVDPSGSFDPSRWIYEHLSLEWPLVNRCGPHCPGPDYPLASDLEAAAAAPIDPRWAALAALRQNEDR